jgi:hypothetical protein
MVVMTTDIPYAVHTSGPDRVRARTHWTVNARLDAEAAERLRVAADQENHEARLERLAREWDFERVVEAEAAFTGLAGLALAAAVDRRFLIIPGVATAMMLLHALHGWYPLLPLLRRMGIRTQDEIDRERFALKSLRGDFAEVRDAESASRAEAAWRAVHL